ncbi:S1 RNA-binding domain-containing protein 1 isoform X2 [Leptopilina boulardi]|uniref:S1 RNA-binding domain-containing protein 1 isoform X2 n=1 Tax=Leptopilina boulardi TaxID=63433 RepID=UPI0021F55A8F|nr:S1 RNA-binding domain-containing protein 1 isoform X2 [Leptopilina boulardi]
MAYYHDYYNDYDFYDDVFDLYFDDFDNYFNDDSEDQIFNIYLNNCEEDFGHRAEAYRNIKMAERKKNRKRTKAEADQAQSTDDSTEVEESDLNLNIHGLPCIEWTDAEYISDVGNIRYRIANNIVELFKEDNTIPFIARYRKNMTGGMEAEELRTIRELYDRAKIIRHKAATIIKTIDKQGKWTPDIHAVVKSTKSLNDLEHIASMFKTTKRSLAEKARELGLEPVTNAVIQGQQLPNLYTLINPIKDGLKSVNEVKEGIVHILSDLISKDKTLFEKIRELRKVTQIQIEVSEGKAAKEEAAKINKGIPEEKKFKGGKKNFDSQKYEIYYDFKSNENHIKSYQILAINRGESEKFLQVKILIPDSFERDLKNHVLNLYQKSVRCTQMHRELIHAGYDYSYKKSIKPAIARRFRNEMNEKAEIASIEVFATNLKQLILTPPFKGKPVLGIDPGFYHGCKLAVVSENGDVIKTKTIFPHSGRVKEAEKTIIYLVEKFECTSVALGNGTACRETEKFLSDLIKSKAFGHLEVSFTIINEAGASIYSCSEEAKKEFPDMDPNLISAVSIARRLQDPLAELVKVEPKHLGVGMYQHDVPEKQLDITLNSVVTEAVSFVGVDVNTASHCLLRKIAGLNALKATNIIDWRKKNGSFTNRVQLLNVKGIGNKTYEQCAGFIRIVPETALVSGSKSKLSKPLNNLDQTWIHPESYDIANKIIQFCHSNINDFGKETFINCVKTQTNLAFGNLAKKFSTDEETIEIIVKGLTSTKGYDIRSKLNKQVFRSSLTTLDSLKAGSTLNGVVRNVTHFGAFVDTGVSRDGLIPNKYMKGITLGIGQSVEVKVLSVEKERNRFAIELIKVN